MKSGTTALFCGMLFIKWAYAQNAWVQIPSNTYADLNDIAAISASLYTVGDSGVILTSSDYGITWSFVNSPVSGTIDAVSLNNTNSIFIGSSQIYHSANGGSNWSNQSQSEVTNVSFFGQHGLYVKTGAIYESTNNGNTWILEVIIPASEDYFTWAELKDASSGYALGNGGSTPPVLFGFRKGEGHFWRSLITTDFSSPVYLDAFYFKEFNNGFFFTSKADDSPVYSLYRVHNFVYDSIFEWLVFWEYEADQISGNIPEKSSGTTFISDSVGLYTTVTGNIYVTFDGGENWLLDYAGTQPLHKIIRTEDSSFVAVRENGTILKRIGFPTGSISFPVREDSFFFFPNPADDFITVCHNGEKPKESMSLNILSMEGKILQTIQLNQPCNPVMTSTLKSGI